MDAPKELLTHHALKVDVRREADDTLLHHIESTVLGTPGHLRYRFTQSAEKMKTLTNSYFFILSKADSILGSVGFCHREAWIGDRKEKVWYLRYFSIKAPMRSKPSEKRKKRSPDRGLSVLKRLALPYMNNPDMMEDPSATVSGPTIIQGYIEKNNQRSVDFSESMGLERIGSFTTRVFSRLRPRMTAGFGRLAKKEEPEMRARLRRFYAGHCLYSENNLFYRDNYFVLRSDGRIVAGVQANPDAWEIKAFGNPAGDFLVKVLPWIPLLRRIINPRHFRFLEFEGFYFEEGYESALPELLESALAHNKLQLGMTWLDLRSPVLKVLEESGKLGRIDRLKGEFTADIRVKFVSIPAEVRERYFQCPVYISGFDMT
ncbi:MAG: hypothetical protein ACOYXB_12195 [Bacteroidota bacterium]